MTDVVLVLTTVPVDFVFSGFARTLVEQGHAACVSVLGEADSTYRWQGAIEAARERQVLIKTTMDRVSALEAAITALHPYDVPEFLVLPTAGGSEAYLSWVRGT
jgi:periplasmic divalent cation tolerance protein